MYHGCMDDYPITTLICCHQSLPSGANLALLDWVQKADKSKIRIIVLLPLPNPTLSRKFKDAGCTVWVGFFANPLRHTAHRNAKRKITDFAQLMMYFLVNWASMLIVYHRIRKSNVAIIHSNSFAVPFGAELALRLGIPHVWHVREFMEQDHHIQHRDPAKIAQLANYSHAIFISPMVEKVISSQYTFRSSKTLLDRVELEQSYVRTRSFMEDGTCRMLIAGTIMESKGQADAVRATIKLHRLGYQVDLNICGQGDLSTISQFLNTETNGYIHYLGQKDDLVELRKNEDIALVCSRNEAFGRVTIESMFYENVVIGANAGYTKELIRNGENGFLYNPEGINDLASVLQQCINNPQRVGQIIANAKAFSGPFAQDISPAIIDYYQHILNTPKP